MIRLLTLAVVLALIAGCGKSPSRPDSTSPKEPPSATAKNTSDPAPDERPSPPVKNSTPDEKPSPPIKPSTPVKDSPEKVGTDLPRLKPKSRFQLPGKHGRAYNLSVQVSADGSRVALGTNSGTDVVPFTQVWQISAEPKVVFESEKHYGGGVFALSPSGKRVLVSASAKVYDVDTRKELADPGVSYFSHGFFKDENTVVFTQRSHDFSKAVKGRITVWDVAKNKDAGSFEAPDDRFRNAFPARNGSEIWLFLSAKRFEIECYDIATKQLKRTIKPELDDPKEPFTDAGLYHAVALDGSVFVAHTNSLKAYDGQTGKIIWRAPREESGFLGGLEDGLIPGSRYLGTLYRGKTKDLALFNWKTGKCLATLAGFSANQTDFIGSASADGKTLVVASQQGEVLVFDISSLK